MTFPDELWIDENAYIQDTSANMDLTRAQVSTNFNQILTIKNAFPSGYLQGDIVSFTVVGVTNPRTTEPTHPIKIDIYYESSNGSVEDELIDVYDGFELVFRAEPSPHI